MEAGCEGAFLVSRHGEAAELQTSACNGARDCSTSSFDLQETALVGALGYQQTPKLRIIVSATCPNTHGPWRLPWRRTGRLVAGSETRDPVDKDI